ncbi:hypothetical protein ACFV2X_16705 [Streptomyces sp. NPDC059679]
MEELRRQRAEQEERRAREQAEREEKARRAGPGHTPGTARLISHGAAHR